jgi:hypothetical protein
MCATSPLGAARSIPEGAERQAQVEPVALLGCLLQEAARGLLQGRAQGKLQGKRPRVRVPPMVNLADGETLMARRRVPRSPLRP